MSPDEVRGPDRRDTEEPHRAFGRVLEAARESYGLNRNVLAGSAGVAYSMLYNVERGRRRASDAFIKKVAPKIGLRADRMIKVRNALEVDRKFPLGRRSELQKFMVGQDGIPSSASMLERRLNAVLEEQIAGLFADADTASIGDRGQVDAGHADRRPQRDRLVQALQGLSGDELSRVQGYIDRLLEERESRTTVNRAGRPGRERVHTPRKRPTRRPGQEPVDKA